MYFTLYKYIQKRAWGEQKFNPAAIPRGFPLVPKLRKSFSLSLYILYIHSSGYIPGYSVYVYIYIGHRYTVRKDPFQSTTVYAGESESTFTATAFYDVTCYTTFTRTARVQNQFSRARFRNAYRDVV